MRLSPRQLHVAHFGRRSTAVVIASGPVSSGKTEAAGRGWVQHTGRAFSGHNLMIVSRSHAQMLGVIVSLLARVTAKIGVPMIRRARWYDVGDAHGGFNQVWPMVANDSSSVERVQGFTLAGVWAEEVAVLPWPMIQELRMRLRVPGAKFLGTCNPEGPDHKVKTELIDKPELHNCEAHQFSLFDNPSLSEEYLELLRTQFKGSVYLRKVLGLWAAATGVVHAGLPDAVEEAPRDRPDRIDAAVDWAQSGITHAIFAARFAGRVWVVDEWRHDGEDEVLLPEAQAQRLAIHAHKVCTEWGVPRISSWLCDPTASGLMVALRRTQTSSAILPAIADEAEGINVVNDWLRWRLRIDPRCLDTIGEAGSWPWDKRAAEHGVDRPVKTAEHAADCLRYLCHSIHTAEATAAIQPRILDPYSQDLPARVTDIMASERLSF